MDDEVAAVSSKQILFIGEDYGRFDGVRDERYALTGKSGKRLAELAGVSMRRYLRRTDRMNIVALPEDWGSTSSVTMGVHLAMHAMDRHERTLLLGRRVAVAMGHRNAPLFEWDNLPDRPDSWFAVLPHPSGRNRMLNDAGILSHYAAFLHAVFASIAE